MKVEQGDEGERQEDEDEWAFAKAGQTAIRG
jgi:hypothetical protein